MSLILNNKRVNKITSIPDYAILSGLILATEFQRIFINHLPPWDHKLYCSKDCCYYYRYKKIVDYPQKIISNLIFALIKS